MRTSDLVIKLCETQNITVSELGRRIGQSPQNLSKKLKRDTLTADELLAIAEVTGASFEQGFKLPDGRKIYDGTENNS